jgi:hypothetical protein
VQQNKCLDEVQQVMESCSAFSQMIFKRQSDEQLPDLPGKLRPICDAVNCRLEERSLWKGSEFTRLSDEASSRLPSEIRRSCRRVKYIELDRRFFKTHRRLPAASKALCSKMINTDALARAL